jgi:hypothetical protein
MLFSAVLYVVQGYTSYSNDKDGTPIKNGEVASGDGLVKAKSNEDWTVVLYTGLPSGGQCGGTSEKITGSSKGGCFSLMAKLCASLRVNVTVDIASCYFNFKLDGMNFSEAGDISRKVTAGTDNNGVALNAEIKFVCVECKL